MEDQLVLTVVVKGQNIMGNPLLNAHGIAIVKGKKRVIDTDTPITSIDAFIKAFEELFQKE